MPKYGYVDVLGENAPNLYEDLRTIATSCVEIAPGVIIGYQRDENAPTMYITVCVGFEFDGVTPVYFKLTLNSYLFLVSHHKDFEGESLTLEKLKSIVSFTDDEAHL